MAIMSEAAGGAPQNGFMFIGELAAETGADPKTIRFYERAGLLAPPRHGRVRTYMDNDVKRLKRVLALRRMGVSLARIRDMLDQPQDVAASSGLACHLETLRARQAELDRQMAETAAAMAQGLILA
jgi:DNA-binding transcriptional MerR regulator